MSNMKKELTALSSFLLLSALLVGCGSTSAVNSPTTPEKAITASTAPTQTVVPPTAKPSPTAKKTTEPTATTSPTPIAVEVADGTTQAVLATLAVKGKAPKTGYKREAFGKAWADVDKNGCDTRNDILNRDLTNIFKDSGCKVKTGVLADTYTGTTINFVRGNGNLVDIDHMVALGNVWITGGQQLTDVQRLSIANDPLNLRAVDAGANRQKGDSDAASWLPSNKSVRCDYVAHQIAVKAKYKLWVTESEKQAMSTILTACPDFPLPTEGSLKAVNRHDVQEPIKVSETPTTPTVAPVKPAVGGSDPKYASCKEAKAHGLGPYTKDRVEYGYYKDGDKDGVVCE